MTDQPGSEWQSPQYQAGQGPGQENDEAGLQAQLAEARAELERLRAGQAEPAEPVAQLTPAEIAEFRRLQREAADRAAKDREARRVEEEKRSPATHHVLLANGDRVQMSGGHLATHHTTGDGSGHASGDHMHRIAGAWPMNQAEVEDHNRRRLAAARGEG